jgi:hypothetical protein
MILVLINPISDHTQNFAWYNILDLAKGTTASGRVEISEYNPNNNGCDGKCNQLSRNKNGGGSCRSKNWDW